MAASFPVLISSSETALALQAISDGTSVDTADEFGWTPLHWAAQFGNARVIHAMASAGAEMVAVPKPGETPLHVACEWGATAGVAALLSLDALLDPVDQHGDTPLMKACRHGYWRCARLLLAAGMGIRTASDCSWSLEPMSTGKTGMIAPHGMSRGLDVNTASDSCWKRRVQRGKVGSTS